MASLFARQSVRSALRAGSAGAAVVGRRASPMKLAAKRSYATGPEEKSSNSTLIALLVAAGLGGGAYYYYTSSGSAATVAKPFVPTYEDYKKVYNDIAECLEGDDYDDGSYGPVLLRLAWHASGTYDAASKTGGSNGATMRFNPEASHGANAGLVKARDRLEPIHAKYPWISYGDLWTLGGVAAVQELGGPTIPWRPGRTDADASACTPDGRLPDASKGADHIRAIFGRMGFNDQEMVALIGAHALGRCHTDRSGFEGPWTFAPTYMTNDFYKLLIDESWSWRKWKGPAQYEDKTTHSLMMLPTDMALVKDKKFKPFVEKYAKSNEVFFEDFSKAYAALLELGVPFKDGTEKFEFPATIA
ncbi:heme peroxidase [Lipomyces oligophaga]|uniref:heme peroxidase n=1 Tax=Lipomyces oligophaga TaxID=45792 RepID=UPI0034CE7312